MSANAGTIAMSQCTDVSAKRGATSSRKGKRIAASGWLDVRCSSACAPSPMRIAARTVGTARTSVHPTTAIATVTIAIGMALLRMPRVPCATALVRTSDAPTRCR